MFGWHDIRHRKINFIVWRPKSQLKNIKPVEEHWGYILFDTLIWRRGR